MYVVVNLQEIVNFVKTSFFIYNILASVEVENLCLVFGLVVITNWQNVGGHIEFCVEIVYEHNK